MTKFTPTKEVKFQISYMYNDKVLRTENRTHDTGVDPSEAMCKNALHTIMLDTYEAAKINWDFAAAIVYRNGIFYKHYKLNIRKSF